MNAKEDLDARISGFLARKDAQFPELGAIAGRHGAQTAKYASRLRASGQVPMR